MYYSTVLGKKDVYFSKYAGEEMLDLLGNTFDIMDDFEADVLEMEEGYECRPDLISETAYMDEMHVDTICKLNGYSNAFEINSDTFLALPTIEFVHKFSQLPSEKWKDDTKEPGRLNTKPKPASRTEKRKPNRAVIGESRFQIDKDSKIVIY